MSSRSLNERYILAIDLGTTTCKVALCDPSGHLVALAREEIPLNHPHPLWAEADPRLWWDMVRRLVPNVLESAQANAEQIEAIGLCGLMHAPVAVGVDTEPLAPSMLWMDQRCQPECELLIAEHAERIRELTGGQPRTTSSAAKLYWLKRHHPEIVQATHQFLLPKDFIRLKLTGEWATDPSDAGGTSLLARGSRTRWAESYVADILGISPTKLPRILASSEVVGVTLPGTSELGLRPGIPVVTGGSDVQATVLGANLHVPDRLCLYMGTAAWIALGLPTEDGQMRIRFLSATATFGVAARWYVEQVFQQPATPETYRQLEVDAQQAGAGADGLIFLPHLMGERGPYANPAATGVLFGLTLGHGPRHIFRSILEGTACQIRHILEEREVTSASELWCVGGGTRNRLWLQIIADVTQLPVCLPQTREAGLLGSAMLAAVGVGLFPDLPTVAHAWVRPDEHLEPRDVTAYQRVYPRYRELDAAVQPFFSGC